MLCLGDTRTREAQRDGAGQRATVGESTHAHNRATKQPRDAYMTALTNAFEGELTQLRQVRTDQQ